jgi:hypothetical protein
MPADIVVGVEAPVLGADQQQAFAGNVEEEIVPGGRYLFLPADTHPLRTEDPFLLPRETLRGEVMRPIERGLHAHAANLLA